MKKLAKSVIISCPKCGSTYINEKSLAYVTVPVISWAVKPLNDWSVKNTLIVCAYDTDDKSKKISYEGNPPVYICAECDWFGPANQLKVESNEKD